MTSAAAPFAPSQHPEDDLSSIPLLAPQDDSTDEVFTSTHQNIMTTVQRTGAEGATAGTEKLPPFHVTPEVISQFLEDLKSEEVKAMLISEEKRGELFQRLLKHKEYLQTIHDFNPEDLRHQLDLVGEALKAEDEYLKDRKSPEKKSVFRRAFDKIRGFAGRHPFVTTLLVLAIAAGATSLALYASGNLELVATKLGLGKIFSGADAAGELFPPIPSTPLPPGAGELGVPPPINPLPGPQRPI